MEHFSFKGFTPSEPLRAKAYRAMEKIADKAPSDGVVVAVLERDGDRFHCSIELSSGSFPFAVSTSHRVVDIALDKAELAAMRKIERWSKSRLAVLTSEEPLPISVKQEQSFRKEESI